MKRILLFSISILILSNVFCQSNDQNRDYIYFNNGEINYYSNVEFKTPLFSNNYFLVDSNKSFSVDKVKFYNNRDGFYGKCPYQSLVSSDFFAERIMAGNANMYKLVVNTGRNYIVKYYYNIGFGDLKKTTYSNLIVDLGSNQECVIELEKYRKARNIINGVWGAGFGLVLYGVISTISNISNHQNTPPTTGGSMSSTPSESRGPNINFIPILSGAAISWICYFVSINNTKHLSKAITIY